MERRKIEESEILEQNHVFDLDVLIHKWPSPLVARDQRILDQFAGGLLNARTLANADSAGTGPRGKLRIGRKVAYPVDSLVEWMKARRYSNE